jgi:hypothetical protein
MSSFGFEARPRCLPQAVQTKWFDVRQPDMVRSAVRADLDVVAAIVVSAIDQHIESAGCAHFAEGDF